jgi:hypothetical protein
MLKGLFSVIFALLLGGQALAQAIVAATTNSSVTITTGNTYQNVLAAVTTNQQRRSLTIENNNTTATDNCWIAFGTRLSNGSQITAANATKAESILLAPGGSYTRYYPYIPNDLIVGTCVSNGNSIYVDVQ